MARPTPKRSLQPAKKSATGRSGAAAGGGKGAKQQPQMGRMQQIRESYRVTKQQDPKIGLILWGTFLAVAVVVFALLWLLSSSFLWPILPAILAGVLAALTLFGRRAPKAIMASFKDEPGAAARALSMLRRGWKVDPFVAVNRQQDAVTRVVGPPGVVLVGEGNPNRVKGLLHSERRRHERVMLDIPVHELVVGDGEGQVLLEKLVKTVTKLGKDVKPAQMTVILDRLRAIDANRSPVPMPKGPVPTSMKGMRGNLRGR